MKIERNTLKLLILGALAILFFSMKGNVPVESVAAIDGQTCSVDADCPCWGRYNLTGTIADADRDAYGLGIAECNEGQCDMTWCFDVEPVGDWVKENPWQWAKDNPMATLGFVAVAIAALLL